MGVAFLVFRSGMAGVGVRRRHGDIFPLPVAALRAEAALEGVTEPQRAYWIGSSLNKLALHVTSNSCCDTILSSDLPLTAAQQQTCDRVFSSLSLHGPCPDDVDAEAALASLRRDKPTYDGIPSNLASYDASKLKVLRKVTQPKRIVDFLPPQAAAMVKSFEQSIIRPKPVEPSGIRPYWDPALRYSTPARTDFIVKLFGAGLLELRHKPESFVGVFFVKKKSPDQIRMVVDSRTTNELCRDPPVTRLGSARCYAELQLNADNSPGASGGRAMGWGREADVDDCFYRFAIPGMTQFFAIDHPLRAEDWTKLGIQTDRVFDAGSRRHFKPDHDAILYPCFRVVPMGWSWALFLCHEAVVRIATSVSPWNDGILREKKPVPQLDAHRTVIGVYVDNITILGQSYDDVSQRSDVLQQAFDNAGIPITWTHDKPVCKLESVGCVLDLQSGILMNKPRRVWTFVRATSALLRRRKIHGKVMQVWAGHFTCLCSIAPWGLSVLQHTYRFIQTALNGKVRVWSSVRHEMKLAASLAWMTWRSLDAPIMRCVEVGDSATSGYALMSCFPDLPVIQRALAVQEKWRFIPLPDALKQHALNQDHDGFTQALENMFEGPPSHDRFAPAGLSTNYASFVLEALREKSDLKTSAVTSQARACRSDRVDIDVPALIEPLDHFFENKDNFRLLWSRRWKDVSEHITIKEARVLLSSLKRSSRVRSLHGHRKLSVSDNLPAVCAFSKGRSGNAKINSLCRHAAAIQFATGIIWHVRHLETKRNVADEPSRRFEPRKLTRRFHNPSCDLEPKGSGLSKEASAPSKPLQPRRQFVEKVFPCGPARFFLEIFSGTGRLTQAIEESGVSVLEPLDYLLGSHADLRRRATQKLVLDWIRTGRIGFVHLGTPCTIWSQARHNVKESHATRCKEEIGVELALFSAEIIRTCNQYHVGYALENPKNSKLFKFEPIVRAIASGNNFVVDLDMCQYGEEYKKATRLVTSVKWLQPLQKRCAHASHSVWLKGKVLARNPQGTPVYVNRTALAGAYPFRLVEAYARLVKTHAKLDRKAHQAEQIHWGAALRSVAQRAVETNKQWSKPVKDHKKVEYNLHLLNQHGGLENFKQYIALGRAKEEKTDN